MFSDFVFLRKYIRPSAHNVWRKNKRKKDEESLDNSLQKRIISILWIHATSPQIRTQVTRESSRDIFHCADTCYRGDISREVWVDQDRDHLDRRAREDTGKLELFSSIRFCMCGVTSSHRYGCTRDECDDPRMRILVRRSPRTDSRMCSSRCDARQLYRLLDRDRKSVV